MVYLLHHLHTTPPPRYSLWWEGSLERQATGYLSHWSLIHAVQSLTAFFRPCKVPSDDHYSHAQPISAPPKTLHTSDIWKAKRLTQTMYGGTKQRTNIQNFSYDLHKIHHISWHWHHVTQKEVKHVEVILIVTDFTTGYAVLVFCDLIYETGTQLKREYYKIIFSHKLYPTNFIMLWLYITECNLLQCCFLSHRCLPDYDTYVVQNTCDI